MIFKEPRELTLLDDVLARAVFDRKEALQHVLRIILGDSGLVVTEAKTQFSIANGTLRGIVTDARAQDATGRQFAVEVQRENHHDHAQRVRFYGDRIDSHNLEQGDKFTQLPELYIIYISETDIWGEGKTVYTVEKRFKETGTEYKDGLHIIYVNAAIDDGSLVAALMRYFKTCDPNDMSQGALSEAVRYYKTNEEEREMLKNYSSQLYEAGMAEGKAEGMAEGERSKLLALVRNVMANSKLTLDKAMDMMGVTAAERQFCIAQLASAA